MSIEIREPLYDEWKFYLRILNTTWFYYPCSRVSVLITHSRIFVQAIPSGTYPVNWLLFTIYVLLCMLLSYYYYVYYIICNYFDVKLKCITILYRITVNIETPKYTNTWMSECVSIPINIHVHINNYTFARIIQVHGVIDSNVNFTGISESVYRCNRELWSRPPLRDLLIQQNVLNFLLKANTRLRISAAI